MRRIGLGVALLGLAAMVLPAFEVGLAGSPDALPAAGAALFVLGAALFGLGLARDPAGIGDPRAWRRFRKNRGALAGAVLVLFVGFTAFVGPLLAPLDPNEIFDAGLNGAGVPVGPSGQFLLGADNIGRDQLSRLLYGGRVSLAVAFGAVAIAGTLGFCAGLFSGYFRGALDGAIIQLINFVLSLPFLLVAIALNRVIENPSLWTLCVLLGALSWTRLARVTRAKTLQARELEYVQAARALGMGHMRILFRHVVPNVLGPAIVLGTTLIAAMIIIESAMSFLGLGVKPPTASWGSMLRDGQEYMVYAPRLLLWPALLIVATVFGFNLLGEGLRDALDPKE